MSLLFQKFGVLSWEQECSWARIVVCGIISSRPCLWNAMRILLYVYLCPVTFIHSLMSILVFISNSISVISPWTIVSRRWSQNGPVKCPTDGGICMCTVEWSSMVYSIYQTHRYPRFVVESTYYSFLCLCFLLKEFRFPNLNCNNWLSSIARLLNDKFAFYANLGLHWDAQHLFLDVN